MVPPPKPLVSCRGTDLLATVKGPLSRVADSSAAVMTLSGIQFEVGDADVVVVKGILVAGTSVKGILVAKVVGKVMVDCSLIERVSSESIGCAATAAIFTEIISMPVRVINLG